MQTKEKILDDLARLAGGTVGLLSDAGKQVKDSVRTRVDDWAQSMDLVPRAEFERLELMLSTAREEQNDLKKRIEALESLLSAQSKKTKST